jgi:ASC-1-like (ASCH) protein
MMHNMRLGEVPFFRIKTGKKLIEVRLCDEKRSRLNMGDEIVFSLVDDLQEKIAVKVIGISKFKTFRELYSAFDYTKFGHPEGTTLEKQIENERKVYSEENEILYGVMGIHIKLID